MFSTNRRPDCIRLMFKDWWLSSMGWLSSATQLSWWSMTLMSLQPVIMSSIWAPAPEKQAVPLLRVEHRPRCRCGPGAKLLFI